MSAFDVAAAALLADPHLAVAATLVPPVGAARAVRVIMTRADHGSGLGITGSVAPVSEARLALADAPDLAEGWELVLGAERFEIRKPERDEERTTWRCALRKIV